MATPKKLAVSTKPVECYDAPSTDQVTDLLCDLCIHDDETVDANAFCCDCEQYLCISCQRVHQRGTTTKQHQVLKGRSNLPISTKKNPKKPPNARDLVSTIPVEANDAANDAPSTDTMRASKDINAVNLEQLAVGSYYDNYYAQVNARETMLDGSMLVCDYGNYKLKYFDASGKLLHEKALPGEPFGMAQISSTTVIVTLPKMSKLQTFMIKAGCPELVRECKTKLRCAKILRYHDAFLAVGYDDNYYWIAHMDSNGKIFQSFYKELKQSLDIFHSYHAIALSPEKDVLYVTNKKSGLLGMSLNGEIIFKYEEPGEGSHYGVSTDPEGTSM